MVGPSGSGKSSLARAGVAAELGRQGYQVVVITPGAHPMQSLAALPKPTARTVLLVDQAEEAFSLCGEATERAAFFTALVRWDETGPLVLAMRADRLAEVSAYPAFARLLERGLYLLGAMSDHGLRDAIEAPARQAGLLVEPGLVDLLMGEVEGVPGALPMLSHALLETWKRREANTLTVAGYNATGGIRGAVAQSAEKVYASIDPARRVLLRDLVLRLVSAGAEGEPVRARVPRRMFTADPDHEQLIDLLVGSRLVTSDAGVVEIAHEALARAWPRLRAWLDDDLEGQRILHHLTTAATAWDSLGRPESELYRGVRLAQALQWRNHQSTRLTADELAFLEAAQRNELSEQRAAQASVRAQARLIRRLQAALVVGVVLLASALGAGVVAVQQQDQAERNATRAVTNAAAAVDAETSAEARRASALALSTDDIDESMLLAVAGVRLADSPETRSSLLAALGRHPELIASLQLSGPEVTAFDVSPDESTVATFDITNHVRSYDLRSGGLVAQFQAGSRARVNWVTRQVRFSPDGQTLAVGRAAPTRDPVVLLDAHTLDPLPRQPGGTRDGRWQANELTFSQDGRRLASNLRRVRGDANTAHVTSAWGFVWDLDAPDHPVARLRLDDSSGGSLALDAHGRTLYTAQPLVRHDLASGSSVQLPEPWGAEEPVEVVAMSPTGRALAGSGQGGVAMLDPRTGALRQQMDVGAEDDGYWVSFSGDGERVAVVDFTSSEALVWQVASGELLARLPVSDTGELTALGATGATLYTAGSDALQQWDVDGDHRFVSHVGYVPLELGDLSYVRPSPDGRFLAYPDGDDVAFFDVTTGKVAATVTQDPGYRRQATAQWHPDGVHFAAATDGEIRVWDARTGRLVVRARPAGRFVSALGYSTDGSRLVIGDLSGQVTMLDAADLTPVGRPARLDDPVRAIASGPDNRTAIALTGSEGASRFWVGSSPRWARLDLETGDVATVVDVGFDAGTVEVSPDGTRAALGGREGELMVLDLATNKPVREPVTVHDLVVDVSYSEDGSRLLTSGFDYQNALWDGRTGELLSRVVTSQLVTEATFTNDGDTVLIAPLWSGAVFEWDTRPDHAVAFACRVAGRDFSEAEWADQFGDRPYQHVCPPPTQGTSRAPSSSSRSMPR